MRQHPLFFPYLALASVCFFWGTTYLGIRVALEGFPPLLLVGTRFLIAGTLMLAIAFFTKAKFPQGRQLWLTCLYGVLMLGVANGSLTFAEQCCANIAFRDIAQYPLAQRDVGEVIHIAAQRYLAV